MCHLVNLNKKLKNIYAMRNVSPGQPDGNYHKFKER